MSEPEQKQSNLFKYMQNPQSFTLRKWLYELLKEKYDKRHEKVAERISTSLRTEEDTKEFGYMLTSIYQRGYEKAIEEFRGQAEQLGLKIKMDVKRNLD